jgi:hypothetical protein
MSSTTILNASLKMKLLMHSMTSLVGKHDGLSLIFIKSLLLMMTRMLQNSNGHTTLVNS